MNGHLLEDQSYAGSLTSSTGTVAIGAEWGGASVHTGLDMAFFAVYPFVNKRMVEEISNYLLQVLGSNSYVEIVNHYKGTDVASASTIRLTTGNFFDITGTTQIDSVDITSPHESGDVIYLQFDANVQVTDGANLILEGNFSATASDILTLIRIGNAYHEVARSVN